MMALQTFRCSVQVDSPYESVRAALQSLVHTRKAARAFSISSVRDAHDVAGLPPHTRAMISVRDDTMHEEDALDATQVTGAEIYASGVSPSGTQIEISGHCVDCAGHGVDGASRTTTELRIRELLERLVEAIRAAVPEANKTSKVVDARAHTRREVAGGWPRF